MNSAHSNKSQDHRHGRAAGGTPPEVVREMLPFAIYAAIPILITILIAYTFGRLH